MLSGDGGKASDGVRAKRINGIALIVAGLIGLLGSAYDATGGDARTSGFQLALVVALFGSFLVEGIRELASPTDPTESTEIRWARIIPVITFAAFAVAYFGFGFG